MGFGRRRGLEFAISVAVASWLSQACTFPNFFVLPGAEGGASSAGASQAGSGAQATLTGGEPADAGQTTGGSLATQGGEAGSAGETARSDVGQCGQRQYALHCFNHERDDDESDVDCGGTRCAPCAADEACSIDRDCSTGGCESGRCPRLFELDYRQDNPDAETATFRFEAHVEHVGPEPVLLRDLSVRYYFSRNSVAEPIVPSGTATQAPSGDDISAAGTWQIVRQLRQNGIRNDAYLEVGFSGGKVLGAGQVVEIFGQATAATDDAVFSQETHHSFEPSTTLHESTKLAVYYQGQRVWGRGPDVGDPPSCLFEGVNLDGPAVKVGGQQWLGSPASVLARYMDGGVVLKPPTDAGREEMIRFGFFFNSDQFVYPVERGSYALIVYAWSASGSETGTLRVQGEDVDRFRCLSFEGGGPWAPLGPYRVAVDDGQLTLGAQGILRVGGFELRRLDE